MSIVRRLSQFATLPILSIVAIASGFAGARPCAAQTVTPEFEDDYTVLTLGQIPGVPTPYGGVCFSADDPDMLLIGGAANSAGAAIYAVEVERGCDGSVAGFIGEATVFATAPNIDGGLAYGPGGVLFFTAYPVNRLGQIRPGGKAPARTDDLTPLGLSSSVGTLQFVPAGIPGAGSLKALSYNSSGWYHVGLVADGSGTYSPSVELRTTVPGGPEGVVFVGDENPGFEGPSAVVSQYSANSIIVYDVDGSGDAIPETSRAMVTGLFGAEGATLDPVTGEFLFSTFGGGSQLVLVRGFGLPCPADVSPKGGDGQVGFPDVLEVLASWGQACTGPDINRSGEVDFDDVLAVLGAWGPCD